MRIALFEPDIPQNTGAVMRLCACLGVGLDVIGPCGFVWDDARLRRAGLDYRDRVACERHASWDAYRRARRGGRMLLFTTGGDTPFHEFGYRPDDTLLFGRETAGVPEAVHRAACARLVVPMAPGARSLNVAAAAAIGLGEALRQAGGLPAGRGASRHPARASS